MAGLSCGFKDGQEPLGPCRKEPGAETAACANRLRQEETGLNQSFLNFCYLDPFSFFFFNLILQAIYFGHIFPLNNSSQVLTTYEPPNFMSSPFFSLSAHTTLMPSPNKNQNKLKKKNQHDKKSKQSKKPWHPFCVGQLLGMELPWSVVDVQSDTSFEKSDFLLPNRYPL